MVRHYQSSGWGKREHSGHPAQSFHLHLSAHVHGPPALVCVFVAQNFLHGRDEGSGDGEGGGDGEGVGGDGDDSGVQTPHVTGHTARMPGLREWPVQEEAIWEHEAALFP